MKTKTLPVLGFLAGTVLILSFQNCAQPFTPEQSPLSSKEETSSLLSEQETSPPPATYEAASFKVQDAFDDVPAVYEFRFSTSGDLGVQIVLFDDLHQVLHLDAADASELKRLLDEVNFFASHQPGPYAAIPYAIKDRFFNFLDTRVAARASQESF